MYDSERTDEVQKSEHI